MGKKKATMLLSISESWSRLVCFIRLSGDGPLSPLLHLGCTFQGAINRGVSPPEKLHPDFQKMKIGPSIRFKVTPQIFKSDDRTVSEPIIGNVTS